ncbi:DegT/DnrJ/EryC1/StrS family aminotransferase [Nocardioides sp. HB32]
MNRSEHAVPFALPDITEDEIEAVTEVLRSRWITTGAQAAAFEEEFAVAVGAPHAVALNSCTAALHLSLEALGVGPGDLVYVPTYTFAASAEVVRYLGAVPVLVDIDPDTLNIDVRALRALVEGAARAEAGRPAAVVPVHMAGVSCDMDEIWELAREFGLVVVEDAAHAFPATYRGRPVGTTPDDVRSTVCYSFYATKTLTTGEGGMVVTRDEEVAERVRMMSLHGLSRQAWARYSGGTWRYDILAPGYKYNLTDIAAALGRVQLRRAHDMHLRRTMIAARYSEMFADLAVDLPTVPEDRTSAWHLYLLRLHESRIVDRDGVIEGLRKAGVGISVHFIPLHLHTYYRETYRVTPEQFPVATREFERAFSLPMWSAMSVEDVEHVVTMVRGELA